MGQTALAFLIYAAVFVVIAVNSSPTDEADKRKVWNMHLKMLTKIQDEVMDGKCETGCGLHGECYGRNVCICREGYTGENCQTRRTTPILEGGETVTVEQMEETLGSAKKWMETNKFKSIAHIKWPTRTGITEADAESQCTDLYVDNNPFIDICRNYLNEQDLSDFLIACVRDIKITSQLNIAYMSRNQFSNACLMEILNETGD